MIAYFTNLPPPYTNIVAMSNGVAVYPPDGIVPFTNWSPVQYAPNPQLLTTMPLTPLLSLAPFTDPGDAANTLSRSVDRAGDDQLTSMVLITTNVFPYFTNQRCCRCLAGVSNGLPQVTTLTNIYFFTNQPGPTVINYDITQPFTTISTLDLGLFSDLSKTNPAGGHAGVVSRPPDSAGDHLPRLYARDELCQLFDQYTPARRIKGRRYWLPCRFPSPISGSPTGLTPMATSSPTTTPRTAMLPSRAFGLRTG